MVVLAFDMSDLVQEEYYRSIATYDPTGEPIAVDGFLIDQPTDLRVDVRRWINAHLFFTRYFLYWLRTIVRPQEEIDKDVIDIAQPSVLRHTLAEDTADRSEQWLKIFDSILRVRDFCDDRGFEFLLITYPWGHQVSSNEWAKGRAAFLISPTPQISDASVERITRFAEQNHIRFFSAFEDFRAYQGQRPLYYTWDAHWTPMGHEVMAAALESFMLRSGLLPQLEQFTGYPSPTIPFDIQPVAHEVVE
jgi:hypothetical protein